MAHHVPTKDLPASPDSELPSLLTSLGKALEANDVDSARKSWNTLLKQLQRAATSGTG